MWRNGLSALIGIYFMAAPWLTGTSHQTMATTVSVAVGAVQCAVSWWAAVHWVHPDWRAWPNWVAVATGFWFVVHPFLGHFEIGQYWALAGPGIATIVLNLWTMMAGRTGESQRV